MYLTYPWGEAWSYDRFEFLFRGFNPENFLMLRLILITISEESDTESELDETICQKLNDCKNSKYLKKTLLNNGIVQKEPITFGLREEIGPEIFGISLFSKSCLVIGVKVVDDSSCFDKHFTT